jgi:PIN domain nuclease of toxin-antitoxin system
MSSVNFAEVVSKLVERGATALQVQAMLAGPAPEIVDFDEGQAVQAGFLRAPTRRFGLSLADRVCLGLALQMNLPVVTADRIWNDLDVDVEVVLIR